MTGNGHVRFGGGPTEKEQQCHLAGGLPYTRWPVHFDPLKHGAIRTP